MDAACPALLPVERSLLPPVLRDYLDRWDQLDEETRLRVSGDVGLMTSMMRRP